MANKKPKLSELEIKKYQKTIKSRIKKQIFKDVINSENLKLRKTKSRIRAFEKTWKIADSIVSRKFKGGSAGTKNRRIGNLVKESIYSKTGILNEFKENDDLTFEENYRNAEVETYHKRTENFFSKYGDKKDNFGKSLNDYLEDYDNGLISKRQMNNIIARFQNYHLAEYDSSIYKDRKTRKAYSQKYK